MENTEFSINLLVTLMNQDSLNNTKENAWLAVQAFVDNNDDKWMQLMQLVSQPEKTSLLQIAAQNGRDDIVKFIIDRATKSDLGKQILRDQLTQVDTYDRCILHWIAQINKDEVGPCIATILEAAQQLGIKDYVNLKENVYGCTPLMMAVKQGAITNISTLRKYGANIEIRTKHNESIIDLIKYTDPKISIPTMKYFINNTAYGFAVFIKRHGDNFKKIYDSNKNIDKLLSTLIAIDLDAALPYELAQLSALNMIAHHAPLANNNDEAMLILANHNQINFEKALQAYKIKKDNPAIINQVFEKTIEKSVEHKLSEKNSALFAEATFLLSFQLPEAHKLAMLQFILLMGDAPSLALEGFKQINKSYLDADYGYLLMRNTLLTMISIYLTQLGPVESSGFYGMFGCFLEKGYVFADKQAKNEARNKLTLLSNDIHSAKDMIEIQQVLSKIISDNKNLKPFEDMVWTEVMNPLTSSPSL